MKRLKRDIIYYLLDIGVFDVLIFWNIMMGTVISVNVFP